MRLSKLSVVTASFVLTFSMSVHSNNIDYEACQEFVKPSNLFEGANSGIGFMGYLPFEFEEEGKIRPHDDVLSYEFDESSNKDVIVYEVPKYSASFVPESQGPSKLKNPFKTPMRQVSLEIKRDSNGNIESISNSYNYSEQEIKELYGHTKEQYLNGLSEAQKEELEDFQAPFHLNLGSTIEFNVYNDECVPSRKFDSILYGNDLKNKEQIQRATTYDVNLCKELDVFLDKNPEAAACFNKDLNQKVSNIFEKYFDHNDQERSVAFSGIMPGMGGFGGMGRFESQNSIEAKIGGHMSIDSAPESVSFNKEEMDKRIGSSEVITANKILQNCYDRGLDKFINNPEVWKNTGIVPSLPTNSESESSETHSR